jgi:hypothetical protein
MLAVGGGIGSIGLAGRVATKLSGVRGGSKTSLVACAALAFALTVAGCGGGGSAGSSGESTASTAAPQASAAKPSANGGSPNRGPQSKQEQEAEQPEPAGQGGGGAAEFRVPGGDNSVQEFGGEASRSDLQKATAALQAYLDARVAGEWAKACTYLSRQTAESLEQLGKRSKQKRPSCGSTMATLSAGVPKAALEEAAQVEAGALRVEGERAFILYHGARHTDYTTPMAREGGVWKVAALAATPLS